MPVIETSSALKIIGSTIANTKITDKGKELLQSHITDLHIFG